MKPLQAARGRYFGWWLWLVVVVGALWPLVTAMAQPLVPGRGGLSSNEVYAIALTVGGPTNGISAVTATNIVNNNNAASATWATNLNRPYGVSEILVSSPTNSSVESHAGFIYSQTTNTSTLTIGDVWDVGNSFARRGWISLYDPVSEVEATITTTNGRITFREGIELRENVINYARINGTQHALINPNWHNSIEPIYYWGAETLSAQAWTVGANDTGVTNGRYSFLFGALGLGWNLQQTTNALAGANYSTGSGATNVTSWMVGNNAGALRSVVAYNIDADRHIIGGTSRGLSVLGTNVVLSVGTNSITVDTNAISVAGVVQGDGSGLTNLSAEAISGNLTIDTLTATTLTVETLVMTNAFGELYNPLDAREMSTVYRQLTNYSVLTTNGFTGSKALGTLTNTVAGYYTLGHSFLFYGDEITDDSYTISVRTNNVIVAGTEWTQYVVAGAITTGGRARTVYLPASTQITLWAKTGASTLTPSLDFTLSAQKQ